MAELESKSTQELRQHLRRQQSLEVRIKAAAKAFSRELKDHTANGDEDLSDKLMSFTKGLPHDVTTGLIKDDSHFQLFIDGICTGDPEVIKNTPLGPEKDENGNYYWQSTKGQDVDKIRGWESAGAGLTFDLQGPDAQAVTMPPAPELGSNELTAELAEVYAQAILRDIPFTKFKTDDTVNECLDALNKLEYFNNNNRNTAALTLENLFRGFTNGDLVGPYISQFMLAGNNGLGGDADIIDGRIDYGAITIDQKVRTATSDDYMTTWEEYIDVQNGADFRGLETYENSEPKRRFITTGRDLATYVHYDALYQAYLNACLILLDTGAPFDEGVPFQGVDTIDKQQGFAHFGGPHILTLVTEVATRALKAVRYQKFNIHRRLRPEALAARMEKKDAIINKITETETQQKLESTFQELNQSGIFDLLQVDNNTGNKNLLLPMAFCEGSPMHPSYGAGHATVAGACVTILKAFFDHRQYLIIDDFGKNLNFSIDVPALSKAFVPLEDGSALKVEPILSGHMTVEGELNKLAANISIGRNWAGVHYYTDYTESMRLGEQIAIELLEEQALTYNEAEGFFLTIPKFDGTSIVIGKHGVKSAVDHTPVT